MRPQLFRWMLPFLVLPITTCSDSSRSNPTSPRALVGPLCQLGCTEIDPNPSAPGVFLGSGVTPEVCYLGTYTDVDQDGLGDFCEKNLAAAFAPELYYYNGDDVRREPRWVARPTAEDRVMIGYLLSYYIDRGSEAFLCNGQPFVRPGCNGHNGDSEIIYLEVYYDEAKDHWVLQEAQYSQHGTLVSYQRGSSPFPVQLFYPAHLGAYPRAWVSIGKHANFQSRNACNAGGFLGVDTCVNNNTAARAEAGASLNIRSRAAHASSQDCMLSANPSYEYYGSGRQECYWTNLRFRGWVPVSIGGGDAESYSNLLFARGF